ncbi:hypothetical protein G6F24_017762 [Rhizopus arrhizus]|nr:hypothetical protein G6F24_017762 [Rhizopus arrhizus]
MAATEQERIQRLHACVDAVEGVLETATGFAVDLADGVLKCFQRRGQVGVLRIQVLRTLRSLAVLVDGRQVDRLQPAHAAVDLVHGLLPVAQAGVLGQVSALSTSACWSSLRCDIRSRWASACSSR